ncbi:YkvA family protein [Planosporangium sp. 12N6]|uniref:YkvA family protein n=1 Tax=Planosporangium spinosum TaxID=3402278 RepID=UPI003CFA161E
MAGTLRRRMAWTALLRVFRPGTPGLGRRLAAVPRMIAATVRGEYDGGSRLAMMAVAGLYIVSPIDAVPELPLMLLGLVDDAAVAAWFAGALLDETERFLEWERRRATVIPGQTVPGPHPGVHPGAGYSRRGHRRPA